MAGLPLFVQLMLKDNFTGPMGKATGAMDGFGKQLEQATKLGKAFQSAGKQMMLVGGATLAGVGVTAKTFADMEMTQTQLANTMRTVDGLDENYQKINDLAVKAQSTYPGATKDFLDMALAMRQMGTDSKALADGALLGAASLQSVFNLKPVEAAESFAVLSKSMGIVGKDSEAFADAVQRAATVAGMKLPDLAGNVQAMSSSLHQLGIGGLQSSKTILGAMAGLKEAGVASGDVGGVMESALSHMAILGAKLKSGKGKLIQEAQEAMAQAGVKLNFFDAKGNFLNEENFISQFSKLNGLSTEKKLTVGKAFFGDQGKQMALLDSTAMAKAAHDMIQQASASKKNAAINETLTRKIEAVGEKFKNLSSTLGSKVSPMAGWASDKLSGLLDKVGKLAVKHPTLTTAIMGTAAGFGGLTLSAGASLYALGKVVSMTVETKKNLQLLGPAMKGVSKGLGAFGTATWGTVKAIWAQTTALLANPITWFVVGVVALGAAAYLLWKHWDKVTAWFKKAFGWLRGLLAKVPNWVLFLVPFIGIPLLIIKNWDKIKAFFGGLWDFIKGLAAKFWDAGKGIAQAIWEGIKSMASKPVEAIKDIVTKIRNFLPFSPAKEGPLMDLHKVRISETIAEAIRPAPLVRKMGVVAGVAAAGAGMIGAGTTGRGTTVVIQGGINITLPAGTDPTDARKLAQDLMPHIARGLEDHLARAQRRSY